MSTHQVSEIAEPVKAVFPPFEPSIIAGQVMWILICFGILYFVMARVGLPKVTQILDERKQKIRRDREEADSFNRQAEEAMAAYEEALEGARNDARAVLRQRRDKAAEAADKELKAQDKKIQASLDEAMVKIDSERAKALEEASLVARNTAKDIYQGLVGSSPDEARLTVALSGKIN